MKKIILYLLLFIANAAYSQQNVNLANRYFANTYYSEAIPLYLDATSEGQTVEVVRNLADSYYFTNDFKNAHRWYAVVEKKFPDELKDEYLFRYIHSLKAVGNYEAANKLLRKNALGTDAMAKIEASIKHLDRISALGERFTIRHLPFNTEYSEFGAVEFNDTLVFSGANSTESDTKVYKWNNEKYLRLQAVAISNLGDVKLSPKNFAPETNTVMHEGSAVFTKDGKQMYFTRNNFKGGKRSADKQNTSHLQIYRADRVAGKWTNIIPMPFNSESYSTEHPALSSDEKTLYFASDMPGSLGSFDIYSVSINDGAYDIPQNLGTTINSVHKEQFPFVSDTKLYFASDGHFGYGALDIFVSEFDKNNYETPINIGLPVNSGYDDFAFTIDPATKKGYFTSNRTTGKGSDDIYSLVENENVKKEESIAEILDKQQRIDAIMAKEPDVITDANGRLIIQTAPIYFDFDLWYIRKESKPILDRVIFLMKLYPQITVEIGSHTDVRGNKAYNEDLSSKRAASTRTYFIENGVPDSRITSKGYGENVPIVKCIPDDSCSEEQHELNRRSEFVITGI